LDGPRSEKLIWTHNTKTTAKLNPGGPVTTAPSKQPVPHVNILAVKHNKKESKARVNIKCKQTHHC